MLTPGRNASPRPPGMRQRQSGEYGETPRSCEDGDEDSEGPGSAFGRKLSMIRSGSLSKLVGAAPRRLAHPDHVDEKHKHKPFMTGNNEGHEGQEIEEHHMDEQDASDLIANLGNSGMVMVAPYGRQLFESAGLALQGFLLQFVILFYLHGSLVPVTPEAKAQRTVTRSILIASIYLHFVNCIADLPYAIQVMRHFWLLRRRGFGRVIGYPIFVMDAFLIPVATLWIGSLYLCTSNTAVGVIFNACAVAFISNIDNILLTMYVRLFSLGNREKMLCAQVCVPYNRTLANIFLWTTCYVPVVPLGFTITITYYACDVWGY